MVEELEAKVEELSAGGDSPAQDYNTVNTARMPYDPELNARIRAGKDQDEDEEED